MKMILPLFVLCTLAALPTFGKGYQLQTLEDAHATFHAATNTTMYAEAANQYELLIEEEGIRNGHLFYTTGNSWFMAGDVGRSILNYRRAEKYLPHNSNVQSNLKAALELRTDLIPEKEPHPLVARLFGWHLNSSAFLRWWLFAFCWTLFWGAWFWMERTAKKEAKIALISAGGLSAILLASLLTETIVNHHANPGVIIEKEVLARKGDGTMYAPAFLEPLHSGTEFKSLETRGKWRHIRLADGQACWIPADAGETIF